MQIKANGISFNCRIDGPEGAPWLILSNSLATNLAMWNEQAPELGRTFRVLRYDQRGHGGSSEAGRYTFGLLLADAVGLMDALGIAKAHFAGLSMGGATALGLRRPIPSASTGSSSVTRHASRRRPRRSNGRNAIAVAQKYGMEALVEPTMERWFPPEIRKANPPYLDEVREMIRATPVEGFIGCAAALADHDYATAASTVTRPVLFLVGEKDGVAPPAMRKLNAAVAGSRYVEPRRRGSYLEPGSTAGIHPRSPTSCEPPEHRAQEHRSRSSGEIAPQPARGTRLALENSPRVGHIGFHVARADATYVYAGRGALESARRNVMAVTMKALAPADFFQQGPRAHGGDQRGGRQAQRLGPHTGERAGAAPMVQPDRR